MLKYLYWFLDKLKAGEQRFRDVLFIISSLAHIFICIRSKHTYSRGAITMIKIKLENDMRSFFRVRKGSCVM